MPFFVDHSYIMQTKVLPYITNNDIKDFKNFINSSINQVVEHCKDWFLWLCYV